MASYGFRSKHHLLAKDEIMQLHIHALLCENINLTR